jgi:hypothetical protein
MWQSRAFADDVREDGCRDSSSRYTAGMRLIFCLALGVAACKGDSKKPAPAAVEPSSAPESAADWSSIEALATTKAASGPSTELVRALEIAKTHGDEWREQLNEPYPALALFPQGADAIAALKKWAAAKGALPPIQSPIEVGVVTLDLFDMGRVALATAKTDKDIAATEYLGATLYTNGRSLLEAQIGTQLVREAAAKRKELGLPNGALPKLDLVRVLASEALSSRARGEYETTAAGRKELAAALEQMPAHESAQTTVSVDNLIPDEAHRRANQAFWLAALTGAQRGESPDTTLARLQSATKTAPKAIKTRVEVLPTTAKMIVASYESANQPATAQARRK